MEPLEELTFQEWKTLFADDELVIMQVNYLSGELNTSRRTKDDKWITYTKSALYEDSNDLSITLFSFEKEAIYQVNFHRILAYRLLDEHGLCELWSAGDRPITSTFRVGGHGWSKESELSFIMAGTNYSYVIATYFDCVEIISSQEPEIKLVEKIVPISGEVPAYPDFSDLVDPQTRH